MVTDRDNRPTSWDFNQAAAMRDNSLYSASASYLVMATDEDNRPTSWNFNQAAAMRD
jgi:hypothetical protein